MQYICEKSAKELIHNKDLSNKYDMKIVDLYELNPADVPYDLIRDGDTVVIQDDDLSIDVTVRVRSKKWNVFEPQEADIEVDNVKNTLARKLRIKGRERKKEILLQAQNRGQIKNSRTLEAFALVISTQQTQRQQES